MPLSYKKVFFGEFSFTIYEDVYNPAEDSFFFADNLVVLKDEKVLDMGTGSGILGIIAAKQAREVIAIDLNPHAIKCANKNAKLNGVSHKIHVIRSDLFSSLTNKPLFDLILFNAPYVPSEENETDFWLGKSWAGGLTGRKVIDRFISQTPQYLNKTGKIMLMQSTLTSVDDTITNFAENGLFAEVMVTYSLPFFEKLVLLKAQYL